MCYPAAWHPAATLQLESFTEKGTSAMKDIMFCAGTKKSDSSFINLDHDVTCHAGVGETGSWLV